MILGLMSHAVVIGIVGTLIFDAWNEFLDRLAGVRAPNWAILGRWLLTPAGLASGSGPDFSRLERGVGTCAHYLTGVAFALTLAIAAGPNWLARPGPAPAVAAGLITTLFAWFIIMPALGHGIAASRTPVANRIRATTLLSHAVLGLGFYAGALLATAALGGVS